MFALSNGHVGLRGNLDEGEPHGLPGTYLNSVYELRPLPYAEAGYGYPESGQTIINVTNGKLIRLLVNDEPFDVRYGKLRAHERCLDLRAGTLYAELWSGRRRPGSVKVRSVRLVSLTQRAVAAIRYEVEAVDEPLRSRRAVRARRQRVAAGPRQGPAGRPPRSRRRSSSRIVHADEAGVAWCTAPARAGCGSARPWTTRSTARTARRAHRRRRRRRPGHGRDPARRRASGCASSSTSPTAGPAERSRSALHDQVVAALAGARVRHWDGLLAEQRAYLDDFWAGADVEVDGDAEVQQAVRFGLFHILQSGARAEQRPIRPRA